MLPLLASSECFCLEAQTNSKVLQAVHRRREGGIRIESSAATMAGNARTRFYAEPSKEHQGWVHIRYCYNTKYWVLVLDSHDKTWYVSAADEPNEDMGSDSCTLFEPIRYGGEYVGEIRFRTVRHGCEGYVCIFRPHRGYKPYLQFVKQGFFITYETVFIFNGLSRDKELPKYVAFKSINDGKYLFVNYADDMQFQIISAFPYYWASAKDGFVELMGDTFLYYSEEAISEDGVFCTVTTLNDGRVHITSRKTGKFWMCDSNGWIVPTGDTFSSGQTNTFKVTTGDGFIALQNTANQRFCRRSSYKVLDMEIDFLKADMHSTENSTKLVFEEPLFRREIYDVKFDLEHARIHNNSLVSLDRDPRVNNTKVEQTGEFVFTKKIEVIGTWETIVSSTTIDEKHFSASLDFIGLPITVGGEVTLSTEAASAKRRAKANGRFEERIIRQNYIMPPGKTITGEFVAMEASYDVPYSYKRKDIFTNGETVYTVCNDGIYTGVNQYKFQIITTES